MKNSDLLILGGLGAAIYFLSKNRGTPSESGAAFQDSLTGLSFTPQNIAAAQAAGASNAAIVESAVAQISASKTGQAIKVVSSKGKERTISLPPSSATKVSLNKNQYLAPRAGGGYSVVGARNIVLR